MARVARFSPYDTQWLTRASFEPSAARRRRLRRGFLVTLLALLGALLLLRAGVIEPLLPAPLRFVEAQREVTRLRAALDRANAELGLERATRLELQRNADQLNARVAELNQQLEFLNSRQPVARNNREAR